MDHDPFLLKLTSFIKPLPSVADRVLYLARQDPVDFKELTKVIETDPILSTMIVSLANSPMYNASGRAVDSLDRAIVFLGQGRIMDSVMAYMTRSIREDSTEEWPLGDLNFWKHCISVAIAARMLAEKMHIPAADKCFIAGLIHDVGKLALLNYDPSAYRTVIEEVVQTKRPIEFIELGAFGVTHANLAGQISRHWKLSSHFMKAISFHHDGPDPITGTLANVVRSANLLAKIAGYCESGNPYNMITTDLLVPHPRVNQEDIQDILTRLPKMVTDLSTLILGQKVDPIPVDNETKICVSVGIGNGEERVLLRYILSALGCETNFGQLKEDEDAIQVMIMDYLPSVAPEGKHIIDFQSWREQQRDIPSNILNIKSLRHWISGKLEDVKAIAV
ncbi:MAG: HDOD domain-containing protein [Rhodothermaceae bacterium]|nr:HDOD domain-containing protein [Rhodothermaceae bacterium]